MTGQIPPYGKNYTLVRRAGWHETMSQSIYRNKLIPEFEIWAEKGSKSWWIVFKGSPVHGPYPNLRTTMERLNQAILALIR